MHVLEEVLLKGELPQEQLLLKRELLQEKLLLQQNILKVSTTKDSAAARPLPQ
jgi:hypothetical protein